MSSNHPLLTSASLLCKKRPVVSLVIHVALWCRGPFIPDLMKVLKATGIQLDWTEETVVDQLRAKYTSNNKVLQKLMLLTNCPLEYAPLPPAALSPIQLNSVGLLVGSLMLVAVPLLKSRARVCSAKRLLSQRLGLAKQPRPAAAPGGTDMDLELHRKVARLEAESESQKAFQALRDKSQKEMQALRDENKNKDIKVHGSLP